MSSYRNIQDLDLKNKRVFVRVDYNVPLSNGADGISIVSNATRIEGSLPTIKYILENKGKCILASHLGRPRGHRLPKYSLEPVGQKLSELISKDIILSEDCIGDGPRRLSQQMHQGDILLLENVRFHQGEGENSPEFAHRLEELCDVYVNDAFGTLHRAHASTSALPKLMEDRAIGFLVQKELQYLEPLRENPKRPFTLIMGGAKVSDKIRVMEHFLDKADNIIIGGAMAYAFLKAQGKEIGRSLCDDEQVRIAAKLLRSIDARNVKIYLPVDHITATSIEDTETSTTDGPDMSPNKLGADIGPKTLETFKAPIQTAETIFWNGPMGVFEKEQFANGTFELAKLIANSKAQKLAGGGDVIAAISKAGCQDKFDFISTGGGATLEYLEGKKLPGLQALELPTRPNFTEEL